MKQIPRFALSDIKGDFDIDEQGYHIIYRKLEPANNGRASNMSIK